MRPRIGSDPGWPRPRFPTIPSLVGEALLGERGRDLPVAWVARSDPADGWLPTAYDTARATRMVIKDLCQVCGEPRGTEVYVLHAPHWKRRGETPAMAGGALCSTRCARLTAAVCPHWRRRSPVEVWAVPHPGARRSVTSFRDLDDPVDVTVPGARRICTVRPTYGTPTAAQAVNAMSGPIGTESGRCGVEAPGPTPTTRRSTP